MTARVIYIVRSWPRLSQTFIVNEVLALERRGVHLDVISMIRSGEKVVQPQVADVRAKVTYLDDPRPRRLRAHLSALLLCLRRPQLAVGYGDSSVLECLTHATRIAAGVDALRGPGRPSHVHAHFAHDPALVGMFVSMLTRLPFSFTGHARDLYQIPASSLATKAARATMLVTCCEANVTYLQETLPGSRIPVEVIHHGVDLERFVPSDRRTDGAPALVSVGRLVEKKGFDDLLRALARLDQPFSFQLYGDGPLHDELVALRDELGLVDRVEFLGARDSDEIVKALADADAFVLTPTTTEDGDRDGIPNVLVEAMACGLPVVTTTAGGITELVEDDVNGLLCDPDDVASIARAVGRIVSDPELRARLGAAGRRTVEADYDVNTAAARLEALYSGRTSISMEVQR